MTNGFDVVCRWTGDTSKDKLAMTRAANGTDVGEVTLRASYATAWTEFVRRYGLPDSTKRPKWRPEKRETETRS